jgi:hypothetical protein
MAGQDIIPLAFASGSNLAGEFAGLCFSYGPGVTGEHDSRPGLTIRGDPDTTGLRQFAHATPDRGAALRAWRSHRRWKLRAGRTRPVSLRERRSLRDAVIRTVPED